MTAQHWDEVFRSKDTREVSWYQETPDTSLALIADTPGRDDVFARHLATSADTLGMDFPFQAMDSSCS